MEQQLENKKREDMSGDNRTAPDIAGYTMTVEEVSDLFAQSGVPRNPRSIRRFCQNGELDCTTIETPTNSRYVITKSSAEQLIKQKLQALQFGESRSAAVTTGHDRIEPDTSGHGQTPQPEQPPARDANEGADPTLTKRLEDELVNLRIDNRAKEQVITMLRDERREMLAQIEGANYRLGAAETRIAQIEAPKPPDDAARHSAPQRDTSRVEAIILPAPAADDAPTPAAAVETRSEPRRSFFGRLFR